MFLERAHVNDQLQNVSKKSTAKKRVWSVFYQAIAVIDVISAVGSDGFGKKCIDLCTSISETDSKAQP